MVRFCDLGGRCRLFRTRTGSSTAAAASWAICVAAVGPPPRKGLSENIFVVKWWWASPVTRRAAHGRGLRCHHELAWHQRTPCGDRLKRAHTARFAYPNTINAVSLTSYSM